MWKTADKPVVTGVVCDLPSERREGKSGKHFPFFDIFALSIYAPHRCLIGHPSRRTYITGLSPREFGNGPPSAHFESALTRIRWQ